MLFFAACTEAMQDSASGNSVGEKLPVFSLSVPVHGWILFLLKEETPEKGFVKASTNKQNVPARSIFTF